MTLLTVALFLRLTQPMELPDEQMPLLWGETEIAYCRPMITKFEVAVAEDCMRLRRQFRG